MEELLSERQMLTPDVQRPSTPDFLKSKQVKNTQKAESINTPSPSQNLNFSNEINQDVKMKGDTYHLSGANLDSNYGSIDFGNNELTSGLPDVDETIDTNQRLEMLQQERSRDSNFSQNMDINSNIQSTQTFGCQRYFYLLDAIYDRFFYFFYKLISPAF